MSLSYESYWNLTEKPFEEIANTRFFYESEDHREALDRLLYIAKDRNMNMGLLTGEIGSGKTITRNVFKNTLPKNMFELIVFENSNYSFTDILFEIVSKITFKDPRIDFSQTGISHAQRGDKYQLLNQFKHLLDLLIYEDKRHLIILFDEAQLIEPPVIDEIKTLTNICTETQNYLTIVFVGQPELREIIRSMKQVDQRVFLRFHLNNLDYSNTNKYIQHRLHIAGSTTGSIFTTLAYEHIFRYSCGIPREINRLCKLSLTYGFAHSKKEISHDDIQLIRDDMDQRAL